MPQKHADCLDILLMTEHVRRNGMPKVMWRNPCATLAVLGKVIELQLCLLCRFLDPIQSCPLGDVRILLLTRKDKSLCLCQALQNCHRICRTNLHVNQFAIFGTANSVDVYDRPCLLVHVHVNVLTAHGNGLADSKAKVVHDGDEALSFRSQPGSP